MRRGRRAGNGLRYHAFSVCSCSLPIFDSSFRKLLKNIGAYQELVNRGMLALIASVVLWVETCTCDICLKDMQ